MNTPEEKPTQPVPPRSSLIHLPEAESFKWITQQLATNRDFKALHDHFIREGFIFYLERSQVFVSMAQNADGLSIPTVIGIVPSFVPVTPVDKDHIAVGITVSHQGHAVAASVIVNHSPAKVTHLTLHVLDQKTKAIHDYNFTTDELTEGTIEKLAAKLKGVSTAKAKAETGVTEATVQVIGVDRGDQAAIITITLHTLLADKYSSGIFPPTYASELSAQIPVFQKFAFVTGATYHSEADRPTVLCTSTSSNACTSSSIVM